MKRIGKYYNNIRGLLKADIEQEFTEYQVKEIYKCRTDISYFLEKYVKVVHQERGRVPFKLYDFQKKFISEIETHNRILGLISRQAGKTVGISGYLLHYVIFNSDKNVGIVANKGATARKILKGIKNMLKTLPEWLQVGVIQWDQSAITLGNGCAILTDNTSSDSFTGESISILVVDEVAKIEGNLFTDFFDSAMPTVSSSKTAKVIMFSTAKGLNHFYKIWTDAKNGVNEFFPFQIEWDEVPGRDLAWKEKIIGAFGENHFLQEYDNKFMGSSDSLIAMKKLQAMPHSIPIEKMYDDRFSIYEAPIKEENYYLICDYGEGLEQDYSTIQVMKRKGKTKFKQVAAYRDNVLKAREFATIKKLIGEYYNEGIVVGESNIGKESLNELFEELEYENVFFDLEEKNKIGLYQTKKTKKLGCTYLKKFIENDYFEIVDFDTINEISTFVSKKSSYEADKGCHDDLVIPLMMFAHLLNNETFVDWYVDDFNMRATDVEIDKDDILPCFMYGDVDSDNGYVEF